MMEEERLGGRRGCWAGGPGGAGTPGVAAGALPGRAVSPGQCPEAPALLLPRDLFGVTGLWLSSEKTPLPPSSLILIVFLPDVLKRSLICSSQFVYKYIHIWI